MIDNNTKIEAFIQFLKDNNIYDDYIEACGMEISIIKESLSELNDEFYTNYYYHWYETRDGFIFWDNIDKKWNTQKEDYYKQYKRNVLIEKLL